MAPVLLSLIPVFLVIALGYGMRRIGFPGDEIWLPLDQLNYYVLFPALLIHTLAMADLAQFDIWPMASALGAGLLSMVALLMLLPKFVTVTGPQFSSIFQGAARWNSFVAIAAISEMFGGHGVALAAVAMAVLVPSINVLSVVILAHHASDAPVSFTSIMKLLGRNPLILSCAIGIALNATGLRLPGQLSVTASILGDASLTLGLLSVGAGLRINHMLEEKRLVLITSALKLLLMPVLMMGFCLVFGVTGLARSVVLICSAVPGATSSYILARQLGGDVELMATLITGGTVLAVVTMPLLLYVFG